MLAIVAAAKAFVKQAKQNQLTAAIKVVERNGLVVSEKSTNKKEAK